jgi:uncharacterized membrane protein required for colicin V production
MIKVLNFLVKVIASLFGHAMGILVIIISLLMWDVKFMVMHQKVFDRIWRKN